MYNFKTNFRDWYPEHFPRNCHQVNIRGHCWRYVNIGSGNGLAPYLNQWWPSSMTSNSITEDQCIKGLNRLCITYTILQTQRMHDNMVHYHYINSMINKNLIKTKCSKQVLSSYQLHTWYTFFNTSYNQALTDQDMTHEQLYPNQKLSIQLLSPSRCRVNRPTGVLCYTCQLRLCGIQPPVGHKPAW